MDVARDGTVFVTAGVEPEARILKVDPSGNGSLYFTDVPNYRVRKVDTSGVITTVAGTGKPGFSGDGGPARAARLGELAGVTVDREGNIYVLTLDPGGIRRIDLEGTITSVRWGGTERIHIPAEHIWIDPDGNLYLAGNGRIHKRVREGRITILAGDGNSGFYGDGGPATKAAFSEETGGVILAPDGALFIGDVENARVRKVCL